MRFRPGDYLVVDDYSGATHFRSECVKTRDGLIVHRDEADVKDWKDVQREEAKRVRYARPPREVRPDVPSPRVFPFQKFVGNTNVLIPSGPMTHLYPSEPNGIGDMEIGYSFFVF